MDVAQRSYRQVCGVAQALDLLGERWTLLVVRELLLGPKRFGALRAALPGLGANLLAARLRALTAAGVVEHVDLPPPAGVAAYALTPRGEELRPVVESIGMWGFDLLEPERQIADGWLARGSWLASTLAGAARARGAGDRARLAVNFDVDGDRFVIRTGGDRVEVRHGADGAPDGALVCDLPTFAALARGEARADDPAVAGVLAALSP